MHELTEFELVDIARTLGLSESADIHMPFGVIAVLQRNDDESYGVYFTQSEDGMNPKAWEHTLGEFEFQDRSLLKVLIHLMNICPFGEVV